MDSVFIWAQIIGLAAMSINILSWQLKNPRHIIFCYIPACSLWAIQYVLLHAPLGVVMNVLSVIKDSFLSTVKEIYVRCVIGGFLVSIWGIGLYFFSEWYDILPLIGGTIINLGLLQRDNRSLMARAGIGGQFFWITYNLIVGSYMAAISGCLLIISSTIGMARHEEWILGRCHRTFVPSLARSLFIFPQWRTYP